MICIILWPGSSIVISLLVSLKNIFLLGLDAVSNVCLPFEKHQLTKWGWVEDNINNLPVNIYSWYIYFMIFYYMVAIYLHTLWHVVIIYNRKSSIMVHKYYDIFFLDYFELHQF